MSVFTMEACDRALDHLHAVVTSRLRIRYEDSAPERRLPYHGVRHTDTVYRMVKELATTFALSPGERFVACTSALGHDLQMRFDFDQRMIGATCYRIRRIRTGDNERKSAGEIIGLARQAVGRLTDEHEVGIREAILATIPEWDSNAKTFVQPYLRTDMPLHLRLLAFADLNMAGIDPEHFIADGVNVYIETNVGAMQAARQELARADGPDLRRLMPIAEDVRRWLGLQADFARGREARFDQDVDGLRVEQRELLWARFRFFEQSAVTAESLARDSLDLSPQELFGHFLPALTTLPEHKDAVAA